MKNPAEAGCCVQVGQQPRLRNRHAPSPAAPRPCSVSAPLPSDGTGAGTVTKVADTVAGARTSGSVQVLAVPLRVQPVNPAST